MLRGKLCMRCHAPESIVALHQTVVGAFVDHPSILHHEDPIAGFDRGQAVGHHDDGFLAPEIVHCVHDQFLGDAVERAGGFVEKQDVGVVVQGSGDADELLNI